ncbi:MAG: WG repeat-containing protein [Chitinophagaceae bacterium]
MKYKLVIILLISNVFLNAQNPRFLIPYRDGAKWGFCDTLGKVIIQPKFNGVSFFEFNQQTKNPVAKVIINDSSFMYIDSNGKKVLPMQVNKHVDVELVGDKVFFKVRDNKTVKFGLQIDNKLITDQIFDDIACYKEFDNSIIVSKKSKYGLIDAKGNMIIPIEFDKITFSVLHTSESKLVWYGIKGNAKAKFEQAMSAIFDYKSLKDYSYNFTLLNDEDDLAEINKEKEQAIKRNPIKNISHSTSPSLIEIDTIKHLTFYDSLLLLRDSLKISLGLDSIRIIQSNKKFFYIEKAGKQGIIDDSLGVYFMTKKYNIQVINFNSRNSWLFNQFQSLVLFVYKENDKLGITNEFDDTILNPIYDKISWDFEFNGFKYYTEKGSKQGIFIPNTYYKPIPPNYNILLNRNQYNLSNLKFKVNSKWSFLIFSAYKNRTGNQKSNTKSSKYYNNFLGYIGENGVEYFKN